MNRQELARVVALSSKSVIADVLRVIDVMTADVEAHIAAGGLVCWPRFGTWFARHRKPRLYSTPLARKRSARTGEPADKFKSLSLPKWDFCFTPAINFKRECRPKKKGAVVPKPSTPRAPALVARVSERVEISTVEVEEIMLALLAEIIKRVAFGEEIRLDGFGVFATRARRRRRYSVVKKGGGRELKTFDERPIPVFYRHGVVNK